MNQARPEFELGKDLVGLEGLSAATITGILDTAEPFKEISERAIKKVPVLRGKTIVKGETLVDTARNLEAMRIDMVVIRHASSGAASFLADRIPSNVINGGDGQHEHPTQALLDMLTIRDRLGRIEGLKVCIVGDIVHSRVARSNIFGLRALGADVAVCGPRSLIPYGIEELGVETFYHIEDAKCPW